MKNVLSPFLPSTLVSTDVDGLPLVNTTNGRKWISTKRLWWAQCIIVFLFCFTIMSCILLAIAVMIDNAHISDNCEQSLGTVVSTNQRYTVVQFYDDNDNSFSTTKQGINFPSNLSTGNKVVVEYDRTNPQLARIQGRSVSLMVWPLLSVALAITFTSALSYLILLWIKKTDRLYVTPHWEPLTARMKKWGKYLVDEEEK